MAALLLLAWLIAYPHTPDLAAQVYRVGLFDRLGFTVWDAHWYAGHDLPAYSLLFPALGSLLGVRLLSVLAALASSALFERIAARAYGPRAGLGAGLFALGAVADVWQGRLTFALGVPLALGAIYALVRSRRALALVLALLCAAASPVAALLLGLAALTRALERRSLQELLLLALPGGVLVAALSLLFPEGGFEPFPLLSFLATAAVTLAFLAALPASERPLRIGALLYLPACVAALLIHTPVGSNIERYGVLLAGPLLLCALLAQPGRLPAARLLLAAPALFMACLWVLWGPVRETEAVAGNESTSAAYYAPVERYLATSRAARCASRSR